MRDLAARMRRRLAGTLDLRRRPHGPEVEAAGPPPPPAEARFDPLGCGRRLRVLLVCLRHDYGNRRRGVSYETVAFRDPLGHLGCEVVEAPVDALAERVGRGRVGECVMELAFRHDPDLLFYIPFRDELPPSVLARVRDELGIPVLAWFCDDQWRFTSFTRHLLPSLSIAVTTAATALPGYRAAGFERVLRSQWSANHRVFRRLPLPAVHDASFVGQPHSDRRELVDRLRRAGVDVVTRGFGWPEGRASLREMVALSNRSRMCLNFSNTSRGGVNQVKGRDFEIPAMGRPMVTAYSDELAECFGEGEVAVYRSPGELVEVVVGLLWDEPRREAIAAAGHRRCLRDHTAERRLGDLLREVAARGWLTR